MFGRKIALLSLLLMMLTRVSAQQDVSFAHYWALEPSFNPAAIGKQQLINVTGAYAMSMAGFENNPKTMYFSGDMPFTLGNSVNGVGVQLMSDQIGLFTHQRLSAQFAHKKKMFGGTLSIGVQAGLLTEKLDGSELDLDQTGDPAFNTSEVNGQVIDFGAGLYYTRGRWYVGLSGQHLTSPTIELGETNELKVDATFYLTSGYNIKLRNPFLTIHPSMLVRYDGLEYRGDVTARLEYNNENKHMYLGAGYSPGNSITAFIGGSFQGIQLGYSYEFYTSGISLGNGSHELFVNYQTDINLTKKGKNKHKSVRIL